MVEYYIDIYTDLGHYIIGSLSTIDPIPIPIYDFVNKKIQNKLLIATDIKTKSCQYFILNPKYKTNWTYHYNGDVIHVKYHLYKFNKNTMVWVGESVDEEPICINYICLLS